MTRRTIAAVAVAAALTAAPGAEAMTVAEWLSFDSDGIRLGYVMGVVDGWGDYQQTREHAQKEKKEPTSATLTPVEMMYLAAGECAKRRSYWQHFAAVKQWMAANPKLAEGNMAAVVLVAILDSCGVRAR